MTHTQTPAKPWRKRDTTKTWGYPGHGMMGHSSPKEEVKWRYCRGSWTMIQGDSWWFIMARGMGYRWDEVKQWRKQISLMAFELVSLVPMNLFAIVCLE